MTAPDDGQLTEHIAEHHRIDEIHERLIAALDGPETVTLDGTTVRLKEQGVVWQCHDNGIQLTRIEKTLANGVRTRMDPVVKAAVVTAAAALTAAAIPRILELL